MVSLESHHPPTPDTQKLKIDEAFEYSILTGHNRTDGSYKTGEQLRMEYIQRTDRLIHTITDGVEIRDPDTGELSKKRPDTVIFLDKSARPVAWLMRALWNKLAIDENEGIAEQPDIRFLNIDRKQWVNTLDIEGNGVLDINRLDKTILRSLRSIFVSPIDKQDGLTEKIDIAPASLDGKTILVVDEVHATGRTLSIAQKLLQASFPTAQIAGIHWMSGVSNIGQATGNADLPVWYKQDDPRGRGVNDRMKDPSRQQSGNLTQNLGKWFLSTPFRIPDKKSNQLRAEIKNLAHDPNTPIRIATERYDIEDDEGFSKYQSHMERVNGEAFSVVQAAIKRIQKNSQSRHR